MDVVYTDEVERRLSKVTRPDETLIDRGSVDAYRVLDDSDRQLGIIVRSTCRVTTQPLTLWWSINAAGKIHRVESEGGWPNQEVREAFDGLRATSFDESLSCSTPGEVVASEILAIVGAYTEP